MDLLSYSYCGMTTSDLKKEIDNNKKRKKEISKELEKEWKRTKN